MKRIYYFFGSIAFLLLVVGCAKQTLATKPYHNLTGRYNAYYNANMILAESFEQLDQQHQDNYNQLLPLYPYAAVEDAKSVTQQLDEAITKSARNVKLHTIGNWTDDSYHLLGQAEFLQQEYERAANTFKYVVDKYRPEVQEKEKKATQSKGKKKVKKKRKKRRRRKRVKRRRRRRKPTRKKKPTKTNTKPQEETEEEEEPEKYGLKHRPVRYESTLWLAKTYIELARYDEAGYYLRQLENDGTVPHQLRPEIQAVTADYWIHQKEYDKAIPHLEIAVKDTKQKDRKTRYAYILAQLYQQQGNSQLAMEFFHKTLRLKPTYEMEFNARLNMAKNAAQATGKKPIDPILALRRLLRDPKNQEYRDQIHFAIAQIHLAKGDKESGIASLQRSLQTSQNPAQRTEGALLLAELYYDQDDFVASYAYYDTTLMAMGKKDERYANTTDRKRRLEGVATHLAAKIDHDSMLTVASWDRARQERWAVNGMEREEQRGAGTSAGENVNFRNRGGRSMGNFEEEGNGGRGQLPTRAANGSGVRIMDNELQKSKFPLYNPTLRKKGEREFNKRWSNRSWIDDWRRSSKEEDQTVDTDEELAYVPKTQAEIDAYLKRRGVPNSDQEKAAKRKKLATELFLAAQHYREDLNRKDKALELVNELLQKYPTSPYAVEALFLAYNSYREQNNNNKAAYYKTQILNNYPESNIAKVLSDPDFANAEKKRYEQINDYYDETYRLLQDGKAQEALDRVNKVQEKFGKDYEMKARFAILQAMCIGGVKGESDYLRALGIVVTSYPNTTEQAQAKAMIAMLRGDQKGNGSQRGGAKPNQGSDVEFTLNPRSKHLVIVLFENTSVKTNAMRSQVTSFHNKYYLNKRLSTSAILVDGKLPSLTIRGAFNTAEEAMKYVRDVTENPEYLPGVEGYAVYAISRENYALAMTKQKFMAYIPFFKENYE